MAGTNISKLNKTDDCDFESITERDTLLKSVLLLGKEENISFYFVALFDHPWAVSLSGHKKLNNIYGTCEDVLSKRSNPGFFDLEVAWTELIHNDFKASPLLYRLFEIHQMITHVNRYSYGQLVFVALHNDGSKFVVCTNETKDFVTSEAFNDYLASAAAEASDSSDM